MAEAQAVAVSTAVEGVEVASMVAASTEVEGVEVATMVAAAMAGATEAAERAAVAMAPQSPRPATRRWCSAR